MCGGRGGDVTLWGWGGGGRAGGDRADEGGRADGGERGHGGAQAGERGERGERGRWSSWSSSISCTSRIRARGLALLLSFLSSLARTPRRITARGLTLLLLKYPTLRTKICDVWSRACRRSCACLASRAPLSTPFTSRKTPGRLHGSAPAPIAPAYFNTPQHVFVSE